MKEYIAPAGPVTWKGRVVAILTEDVPLDWNERVSSENVRWPDGRELAPGEQFPTEVAAAILLAAGKPLETHLSRSWIMENV